MPKTPMTRRGAELLREELQRLRSVERPAVTQAIADARSHGDLSENAEYDAARRSEEHTSELQSQSNLVCRLLLEKKTKQVSRSSHSAARPRSSLSPTDHGS